jgi:hypothetical protein
VFFELFGAVEVFGEFVSDEGFELVVLFVCSVVATRGPFSFVVRGRFERRTVDQRLTIRPNVEAEPKEKRGRSDSHFMAIKK